MARIKDQRAVPIVLILIAIVLVGARIASSVATPAEPKEAKSLHWVSLEEADGLARMTGRPVLLFFTADWCQPCHQLEEQVFADERLARTIGTRFIAVKVIDRRQEEGHNAPAVTSLQSRYAVRGFPTVVFVDANGTERARMEGFRGREEFERVMETATR
jgi:thiol:disulfide interchange protein